MTDQTPIAPELPDWIASHLKLYAEDPDKGHAWDSTHVGGPGILPVLLLTTKGRKSGMPRTMPLIYARDGVDYVVIASKGGAPAHPAWYLNLVDEPECEIQVAHEHLSVRARTAEPGERERLWQIMRDIYPPYDDYQAATSRAIPVVVLEPG
ncbi:MAG TPA: nitroreductase family deazaflavin-dependent oxidoreductase [Xanthomonadales bacterium]|nr:nitroreductase family deazaflavin-dependent oxidoreductase [Xanthomonadales bacterium]